MQNNKVFEYEVYKRIKLLGEGAFGKAYLVEYLQDKTNWVIKQMELKAMSEEEKRETLKEAKILEAFNHPNIVKFKEVYKTKKGKLCIVMEYADGGDLAKKQKDQRGKPFQENQIIDWFVQICLAIKHVHDRKIIHRDLKGQNIFLTKNNMIKLGDFGIARVLNRTIEKAKTQVGTPYYLSPEIIEQKPYSFKTDIWSLGVILYEMCMLKPPFNADSLHFLALKIVKGQYTPVSNSYSKELRKLIADILQVNPNKRPSINDILKYPLITNRVKHFLSESQRRYEFSHTVIHNQKINANVKMSDFRQVNQELPCPTRFLNQHLGIEEAPNLQRKESNNNLNNNKINKQNQNNNNKNSNLNNVNNFHYKQIQQKLQEDEQKRQVEKEARQKLEEEQKRRIEKQIYAQKQKQQELQRKKEIEYHRKQQEDLQKQVDIKKQKEAEYQNMIEKKQRELEKLRQEDLRQKVQQKIQEKKDQEEKFKQAARDQYFKDKLAAEQYKKNALQVEKEPHNFQFPEIVQNNTPAVKKVQQKPKQQRFKSAEKKNQLSYQQKKKEDDEKLQKLQQQKLEKMMQNKEKIEKEKKLKEQKQLQDQGELQRQKEERLKKTEEQREKMRKDRAKWAKRNSDFKVEIVTDKVLDKQEDLDNQQMNKQDVKTNDDISENHDTSTQCSENKPKIQNKPKKKLAKKPSKWSKPYSYLKDKKQDEVPFDEVPLENEVDRNQVYIEKATNSSQKQEYESGVKNESIQNQQNSQFNQYENNYYENRDNLDSSDENKNIQDKKSNDSSFDANGEKEDSDQKSSQKIQDDQFSIQQQDQMNEMFLEMQKMIDVVDNLATGQYDNKNIFDFTNNLAPPNLKVREDQRLKNLQQTNDQNLNEGESNLKTNENIDEDREDDENEPEMGTDYFENQQRKQKENEDNKQLMKQKQNDKNMQACLTFIQSDYSKLEELKIKLEDQLGFENFMNVYKILKQHVQEQQDIDSLEKLCQQHEISKLFPFLQDIDEAESQIQLAITYVIMEEKWEQDKHSVF